MKLAKQFKKDIETVKNIPSKERKISFIMEYYGVAIVSIVVILALVIGGSVKALTKDKTIMYAVLVNTDALVTETNDTIFNQILADSGMDMKKKTVDINKELFIGLNQNEEEDVRTLQVLSALFTVSDLDLFVSDSTTFDIFALRDAFANLSVLLEPTLLKEYEEDLYYVEGSNGEKYVGGIILHQDSKLHKAGFYHNDVVIGIANNAVYFDTALELLKQILK